MRKLTKFQEIRKQRDELKSKVELEQSNNLVISKMLQDEQCKNKVLIERLTEQDKERAKFMGDTFEHARMSKQLEIVRHIAAGNSNAAICELLACQNLAIQLKVVFADDQTRIASENEMLERLKKSIVGAVDSVVIKRDGEKQETVERK